VPNQYIIIPKETIMLVRNNYTTELKSDIKYWKLPSFLYYT